MTCPEYRQLGFFRSPGWHSFIIMDAPYLNDLGTNRKTFILAEAEMPNTTRRFHWTETYSVHIAILDEQHRHLIEAINGLDQAVSVGEGNAVVEAVLQEFLHYAGIHFATEESLMAQYRYPGLTTHRAKHEEFRGRIVGFFEALKSGRQCVPVSVLFFIDQWLKDHVLRTDQQYSAFLNARGVY
jgi:hemerythrin